MQPTQKTVVFNHPKASPPQTIGNLGNTGEEASLFHHATQCSALLNDLELYPSGPDNVFANRMTEHSNGVKT